MTARTLFHHKKKTTFHMISPAKRTERNFQRFRRHHKNVQRKLLSLTALDLAQIVGRDTDLLHQLHLRIPLYVSHV